MAEEKPFAYEYDFAKCVLTEAIEEEIAKYISNTLTSSETVLKNRNNLLANISKNHPSQNDAPLEAVCHFLELAGSFRKCYVDSLEDIKNRKKEFSERNVEYDPGDKKTDKINEEIYEFDKQVAAAEAAVAQLKEKKQVQCVITPVKTQGTPAVRLVMPIGAEMPVPSETIMDYIYSILNTEVSTTFQKEEFGDDYRMDEVALVKTSLLNGKSFYAIDVFCLSDADAQEKAGKMLQFAGELLNAPDQYFLKRGKFAQKNELAEANLELKPVLLSFDYTKFVEDYMKNFEKDMNALVESCKEQVIKTVQKRTPEALTEKVRNTLLNSPPNPKLFEDSGPYKTALDEVREKHKRLIVEKFCREVLKADYGANEGGAESGDEWVSVEKALKIYFWGIDEKYARKTIDKAVEQGVLDTKEEHGIQKLRRKDFDELSDYVPLVGRRIQGVYDEKVATSTELARQNGLDIVKLNGLIREGKIPIKDTLRKASGAARLYILRIQDTPTILKKYGESN